MSTEFTHLHVHSRYTLLGSTAPVTALAQRAMSDGMTRLALTDTNVLYGAVAFTRACQAAGILPITGMLVNVTLPEDLAAQSSSLHGSGCLVLLATGPAGYSSLCTLSSLIQARPDRLSASARGLSLDDLRLHRDGLICLEGGHKGWVSRALRADARHVAHRFAGRLAGVFGEDNTFLSIELHGEDDLPVARSIVAMGEFLGLDRVAVQPVYGLEPESMPRLRLLAAIQNNCRIDEVPEDSLPLGGDPSAVVHWLGPCEAVAHFAAFPDALARVSEVADRCQPALPERTAIWPVLELPDNQTPNQALAGLAQAGLTRKYAPDAATSVHERLAHELTVIGQHGYAPLFLVVADLVRFARRMGIPVSTRGSVANSLVAYCTGITTVDPVQHDLLFERFLSPARLDAPDIDLDFCSRRRHEVLDYLRTRYGADRVALVATVSTLRPRSAVRDTAKAYGLNETQIEDLLARLPRDWLSRRRPYAEISTADVVTTLDDPLLQEIVTEADALRGYPHHLSVHPGGAVITPGPLTDYLPVQWAAKGFLISQFDHRDVDSLGLAKIDLLGISTLTVLADTVDLIRRNYDPEFNLDEIPSDDLATGDLLSHGDTVGVFQCESEGARGTLRKLRARTVRDLAVANAFFKPGPSSGGMADAFVRRYRGEEPVSFLHPALEPILGATKGVLIFQEQILRIAREVAGLTWEQADHLRRGMSRFQADEMARIKDQFISGCGRPSPAGPSMSRNQAHELWNQVQAFSGYGFNQGHATAYATVSYRAAYIKTHWPAALLCARLANWGGFHHPALYIAEAIRLGLKVRPPHINTSEERFTLTQERGSAETTLWMGLSHVRDLRQSSVRTILSERRRGQFNSLRDLLMRVSLHSREVTHLIQCGALDGLSASRSALISEATDVLRSGSAHQMMLFDNELLDSPHVQPDTPGQRMDWERRILGYPVSDLHDPLAAVADRLRDHLRLNEITQAPRQPVTVAGMRLPGWTGGRSFHLWDGQSWVCVRTPRSSRTPAAWAPLLLHGRWTADEWGTTWFQADDVELIQ